MVMKYCRLLIYLVPKEPYEQTQQQQHTASLEFPKPPTRMHILAVHQYFGSHAAFHYLYTLSIRVTIWKIEK